VSTIVVLAKAPVPGRVKTRLSPPYTLEQAALVGAAALRDTLGAASSSVADHRVLALDGEPGDWVPAGWRVVAQSDGDLGARIDAAFRSVPFPALLVGMDTPQLRGADIDRVLRPLDHPAVDAVLGPAFDGGFWAIGFHGPVSGAFDGVPMSTSRTFASQYARLEALGLRVCLLPMMRDVDCHADAVEVARLAPTTRLASVVRRLEVRRLEAVTVT
jgi:rSAM/selenodomain-associated transferase 1